VLWRTVRNSIYRRLLLKITGFEYCAFWGQFVAVIKAVRSSPQQRAHSLVAICSNFVKHISCEPILQVQCSSAIWVQYGSVLQVQRRLCVPCAQYSAFDFRWAGERLVTLMWVVFDLDIRVLILVTGA
jgi:hypothetical protein